tara:strand:+ start:52 stop:567 length:516 start_codon:yes stop_codon:yes gene_type:complete
MPGSVDEELLKDILEGTLVNTFIKALAIIEAQWRRAPRTYERLRWLVNRWQLLLPEGARDVKATEGWTPEIWSEEGGKLKHGDERNGPWGKKAYLQMVLDGIAAWPQDKPIDKLAAYIESVWPEAEDEVKKIRDKRVELLPEPKPSLDAESVAAAVNGVKEAVDRLAPDGA